MSYTLVPFQDSLKRCVYAEYQAGHRNVMAVCPTGGGKTVVMGSIAHEYEGHGVSIAHRSELVGQMSLALAREGKAHDIIAPDAVIRSIVAIHKMILNRSFYNARANWKVASVDTIDRRSHEFHRSWTRQVGMVHTDEGHHVLAENKWGRAMQLFENAYGLLVTATPERADGRGLGRSPVGEGLVDAMVEGPKMRWLIDQGYLTDYNVLMPQVADLDLDDLEVGDTGDYKQDKMRKRVKESNRIIGDVVDTYMQFCAGKKGITFAVDVEHATSIAAAFNQRGIASLVVTAKTPELERQQIMRRFRGGDLKQLVNVDLFGEGVDVPDVEVVSMARPTASESLFTQQFGRALRLRVDPALRAQWHTLSTQQRLDIIAASDKPRAWIIDHVQNIVHHRGTPDMRQRPWSLESFSSKRLITDGIPMRACGNKMCLQGFERIYPKCPYCGWVPPEPKDRSRPEFVDGDVQLYSRELLQELFAAKNKIDAAEPAIPYHVTHDSAIAWNLRNNHEANKAAQHLLRETMKLTHPPGVEEAVAQRRFFHTFGIDVLTAQGLTRKDADALRERIVARIKGG